MLVLLLLVGTPPIGQYIDHIMSFRRECKDVASCGSLKRPNLLPISSSSGELGDQARGGHMTGYMTLVLHAMVAGSCDPCLHAVVPGSCDPLSLCNVVLHAMVADLVLHAMVAGSHDLVLHVVVAAASIVSCGSHDQGCSEGRGT